MLNHKISSCEDLSLSKDLSQDSFVDEQGFNWLNGQVCTPVCNTGVLCTDFPFDLQIFPGWFTLSFQAANPVSLSRLFETIRKSVCSLFGDEISSKCIPAYGYSNGVTTALGAFFYYSSDVLHFTLKLPETYCKRFEVAKLLLNVKKLIDLGGSITRMDHTIDDYSKQLSIKYIHDSKLTGEMVSRVTTIGYGTKHRGSKVSYECATLGSRTSQLFSRIYDKFVESGGKINSIRWELEFKADFAVVSFNYIFNRAFPYLLNPFRQFDFSADGYRAAILAILKSRFDFRDPSTSAQKWRRSPSQWWVSFCEGIQAASVSVPKPIPSIDKTITWVTESVSTSLNLLVKYFGDDFPDFLAGVIDYGETKLTPKHLAILRC